MENSGSIFVGEGERLCEVDGLLLDGDFEELLVDLEDIVDDGEEGLLDRDEENTDNGVSGD